jgi:hypothetical protein
MGLFERDTAEKEAVFLKVKNTERVLNYLEALATMTSSPASLAKVVASENNAILDLNGLVSFILTLLPAPVPFAGIPIPPPTGESSAGGPWMFINPNSSLMGVVLSGDSVGGLDFGADPTNSITITGLGIANAFQITSGPPFHAWVEIDVAPMLLSSGAGPPTAAIKTGAKWPSASGISVFPKRFVWNTDDGSAFGSTGVAPANTTLKTICYPIGYTAAIATSALAKAAGLPLTPTSSWLQQLNFNLLLVDSCSGGAGTFDCQPWFGSQPADP